MSGQLRHLLRKRFQFSRAGYQRVDLAGQHVTREVRVDRLDDLIVVVPHAGNLGDVLVQPDDVALLRGVGPDHTERLVEDSPDDEAAAVVLQARPSQHPLEADMLLLGQAEGVFAALVVRCAVLSHRSLVLKGFTLPYAAAPQGEHLCMPKTFSAYKGTARPAGLRPPLMLNAKYESGLWERLKERSAGLVRPIRRFIGTTSS